MAAKDIVIVSGGLPHGPLTLEYKSLGGSETAALMVAKELASKGHRVTLFSPLPEPGEIDHVKDGLLSEGVRYRHIQGYQQHVGVTDIDLLIVSRVPKMLAMPHQARKAVLWLHDLATDHFAQEFQAVAWNVSEVWTVSSFHRDQVHEVTGYPLERIVAMRNGIVPIDLSERDMVGLNMKTGPDGGVEIVRDPKLLYYGSRLERGFEFLVMPGGIMEQLAGDGYRLEFSMYGKIEYLPEHVQKAYSQMLAWAERLPNVTFLGELDQGDVRVKLCQVGALVYPSDFEETSCILAREAISVKCPIVACRVGALPETCGGCAAFAAPFRDFQGDVKGFIRQFVSFLQGTLDEASPSRRLMAEAASKRDDLYWDGVADLMLDRLSAPSRSIYAQARTLVEIGDVVPALTLLNSQADLGERASTLKKDLESKYPWINMSTACAAKGLARHYDTLYGDRPLAYCDLRSQTRFQWLGHQIDQMKLAPGSIIVDYGCCEGNQALNLAGCFPHLRFIGIDHSRKLVQRATVETLEFARAQAPKGSPELETIQNLDFMTPEEFKGEAAVVLLTEVLEHVVEPWSLIRRAESLLCKQGGRILTTTPLGPWEAQRIFKNATDFANREHLWHLDKSAMRTMAGAREGFVMETLPHSMASDGSILANLVASWTVKEGDLATDIKQLDPAEKAKCLPNRQIAGAAIITMNAEHDILRMLKSVEQRGIRDFSIAIGPSTDRTLEMVKVFAKDHPWATINVIEVPAIEAGKFGFDDARNASMISLEELDWILWIDCDEELVGNTIGGIPYLRDNAFDSYCIHQHHVTVEPRGGPCQVDKPARLFRVGKGFKFGGKVHEHAEIGGVNGGPGFTMPLPDLDILHIGYKNEGVRRRRFDRNLPFLMWDRRVNPDRKLGKFLWLRDLVHQMRYAAMEDRAADAVQFARDAVAFYNKEWEDMARFGNGLIQGFQYASEARKFLGIGIPVDTQIALGQDRTMRLTGQVEKPDDMTKIINFSLADECRKAGSRYK